MGPLHALAILLSLVAQEPRTETVRIPGTDLKFEMVSVPGGKAKLGSPADEPGRRPDERPVHEVELQPFWMSRTEVTWDAFVKYFENRKLVKVDGVTRPSPPYEPPHGKMGVGSHPAVSMRWHGAIGYCEWASTLTGRRFRLPTEAEFEYAARAGATGAGPANAEEVAWFESNAQKKTQLTGTKKPNAFGLQDLMGNVWEYALEFHDGPEYDPVLRGGGWNTPGAELRFAARQQIRSEWYERDPNRPRSMWWLTDGTFVGFRVVCFADAPKKDQDAYLAKLEVTGLKAVEGTKGNARVTGTLKNAGDRTLSEVELTVYYTDEDGKPVFEDNKARPCFSKAWPVLANSDQPGDQPKALKPGESRTFQLDVPQPFDLDVELTKVGARASAVQFSN
ncbi:MAG TPA: SUMF1/EgtB/PvdO family nonheme iron enzyme [Planctomycetota bacterium]|nr:SUMF1/EgtB/PvdO family nonheme iron enzyme [Planctomycetota bacterium]